KSVEQRPNCFIEPSFSTRLLEEGYVRSALACNGQARITFANAGCVLVGRSSDRPFQGNEQEKAKRGDSGEGDGKENVLHDAQRLSQFSVQKSLARTRRTWREARLRIPSWPPLPCSNRAQPARAQCGPGGGR